jgi:hypothetical protein
MAYERRRIAMHPFEQAVSVIGPIVAGIIVLTLFFKLVAWLSRHLGGGPRPIAFKGILDEETPVTIHLSNGSSFENVRLVGVTESKAMKAPVAYELSGLVILEHADGRRTLIQPKLIRMIEIPPVLA